MAKTEYKIIDVLTPELLPQLSPMMQHFAGIKAQHPDALLFYRLGDFYEMFFEDAVTASRELELTLTSRECGLPGDQRAAMCGVPYHAYEAYVARLIDRGYKVAICEQVEDPKEAKGLVDREVVRVITPGTVLESGMLEEGRNNYIAVVFEQDGQYGCAFADISTGEVRACQIPAGLPLLQNEMSRFAPREVLLGGAVHESAPLRVFLRAELRCAVSEYPFSSVDPGWCARALPAQFGARDLAILGLDKKPALVVALGALMGYLAQTQKRGMECLRMLEIYAAEEYMTLDASARRNLELVRTMRAGEKRGTLLWVLDETCTAMGKRLLRMWVEKPLLSLPRITRRHNTVGELMDSAVLLGEVRAGLNGIFDLERLLTRIAYGSASPRELRSLEQAARRLPALRELLRNCTSQYLREIYDKIDPLTDLCSLIGRAIEDDPPIALSDGGVIREGYSRELDELRSLVSGAKEHIARIEASERVRTGIKNLRVGYNRVFGYYLEVTKSNLGMVPPEYIRKQTLTGSERFITEELKTLEERITSAGDQIGKLEAKLYSEVREKVVENIARIQSTAAAVARLDVFASFAQAGMRGGYCRPQMNLSGALSIRGGRHPVIEAMNREAPFVCNDVYLDMEKDRIAVITGPNMSGKSTYMRMTALIVLMAQIGCYVPADSADLSIVDGIYTRVGAADDLATGQSTFMVEMSEVADILKNATANSLIILDEIGRGTSTFDGMAIARAVVEYIASRRTLGAKAMFATHYHELTCLEDELDGVKNYNVSVRKQGEDVIFLRRIVRGGADESYGIYVSRLAGVPDPVVRRAQALLKEFEAGRVPVPQQKKEPEETGQIVIRQEKESELVRRLREIDPNNLTPIAALSVLMELRSLL